MFSKYLNPVYLGTWFRKRRMKIISEMLEKIIREKGEANIIDIGGRLAYWMLLDEKIAKKCNIVAVNVEEIPQDISSQISRFPGHFEMRQGDGCNLTEYADRCFDLAHSNSVIEHVGDFENKRKFALETRRVGIEYYVQTPYLWFPVEPHYFVPFVHWLPASYRINRLATKGIGVSKARGDYESAALAVRHCDLLDKPLFKFIFPDGELFKERFGPFVKSLIMVRRI